VYILRLKARKYIMRRWTVATALLLASAFGSAQTAQTAPTTATARKPCEDLKAEITKKLEEKAVTSYSLDIVEKGKEGEGKVVGSCDGGTKSIVYSRKTSAEAKPADAKKTE
jgi:hypothetical protein